MLSRFSRSDSVTPQIVAHQASLSMGFSRPEYWSGLSWPPPAALPHPAIQLASLMSPKFTGGFFTTSATWEARGVVGSDSEGPCPCPGSSELSSQLGLVLGLIGPVQQESWWATEESPIRVDPPLGITLIPNQTPQSNFHPLTPLVCLLAISPHLSFLYLELNFIFLFPYWTSWIKSLNLFNSSWCKLSLIQPKTKSLHSTGHSKLLQAFILMLIVFVLPDNFFLTRICLRNQTV